ncbi:MAG TPA: ATP-binding cassette domain-containing protein [Pseudogracilibacillus sp.]|nr:ATP-binding cassette domain-containing protein [Pseudogracilibacillus sp.]
MIRLENVSKTFQTKNNRVQALRDVTLHVKKGEIYGVIGYSGAGKSTLVRCVNLLERPTEGKVFVGESELTALSHHALNESRKKIGMIFQGFNLLKTATVKDNIVIPLKLSGVPAKDIDKRVKKYLQIVGLEDKETAYPAQLSGGQKQRVAIARALAHEPEVLLSDEATSALDPETTDAILELLLKINQELGVTILLITHEMNVVQKICDRVAVMEDGKLVESGTVLDLFASPKHQTTKRFVNSLFEEKISDSFITTLRENGNIITLSFVGSASGEPALAMVSKKFEVYPNILSGHVTQLKNDTYGRLTVHLQGHPDERDKALHYLKEQGVQIEEV